MKINIGSWKRERIPGFTNVDLSPHPNVDEVCDARKLPFKDSSAELVYASHVLEYFDREEAIVALKEWKRVLEDGGTLRLAVPDFRKLVLVYQMEGKLKHILGPLYGKMMATNKEYTYDIYHKTVYDYRSLKEVLESVGFTDVREYDWRKTIHKDYDDHSQAYFPHMDKEKGVLISLNVECTK